MFILVLVPALVLLCLRQGRFHGEIRNYCVCACACVASENQAYVFMSLFIVST